MRIEPEVGGRFLEVYDADADDGFAADPQPLELLGGLDEPKMRVVGVEADERARRR